MKRQLIYYTHVNTSGEQSPPIHVQTRLVDEDAESISLKCQLDRISRDGMTLSCDRLTLDLLMPNRSGIAPKNPVSLETEFSLHSDIKAKCRVTYIRRVSKNEFILELKFCELAEKERNQIDKFIDDSLNGQTLINHEADKKVSDHDQQKPSLHKIVVTPKAHYSKVA